MHENPAHVDQPAGIIEEIAPDDAMFAGSEDHYFMVGRTALEWIRIAMLAAGKDTVGSILDLPCGHGRVLRTLKAAFPEARLAACDISQPGVDFCAATFGATPIYGMEEPDEIELPKQEYDLAFCGSLFTHVSAERWRDFLELFHGSLAPGGLLLFSSHGREHAAMLQEDWFEIGLTDEQNQSILDQYDRIGFGYEEFEPENLNPKLPTALHANYGISLATPSWVCSQVEAIDGFRVVLYTECAWPRDAAPQDVIACVRVT